jgi:hypothetical protein
MSGHVIAGLLTLIACFMLLCRIDKMKRGTTKPIVFLQHAAMAMGMFASVVLDFTVYEDYSNAAMALGVIIFFALSVKRWAHGAPEDTTKPMLLEPVEWNHVSGGKRE